ncbi:MAG: PIG-L deacetylase family protein [Terriglobia bacterium]
MVKRESRWLVLICGLVLLAQARAEDSITIEGAPADTGFNVGSEATIRASLRGETSADLAKFVVFADISYIGTTAVSSVQLDLQSKEAMGRAQKVIFEGGWPIPADAPTGIYTVTLRVEDRAAHKAYARQKIRGFGAYKKLVRIAHAAIDRTFYVVGQPIQCEVVLENLTHQEMKDLKVEFSNANYPWISLFSSEGSAAADTANPELGIKVLRDHLNLAPRSEVTIPMMQAGTARFLQGQQVAVMGAGGPARHEKVPPPEVDSYTVAVWNADRTILYDMQFTTPAIVRAPDRERPTPYGRSFTHPYNSDIDFKKYREFYSPEQVSPAIALDRGRTLFRPGDAVPVKVALKNPGDVAWKDVDFRGEILDASGKALHRANLGPAFDLAPGQTRGVEGTLWTIPGSFPAGVYALRLSVVQPGGGTTAQITSDFAVNSLPNSLLVICAHEDDEQLYAGLMRAAVEAGVPVEVLIFTGGDVGACERYYSKPCGPNEAREFGMVRMEETMDALGHIGVPRDKVIFLGLPDGGSGAIWSQNIKAANPFLSIYLATDHAPYETVLRPNLPFAREPVIELVKQIITDFKPGMLALTHPDERHVDHRTANWFAMKACHELLRAKRLDPSTVVLADVAYGAGGFKPAPYRYEKAPVYLSGEAAALKQEMMWLYQSQDGNLYEGMRRTYSELPREENHLRILDWQEHEGWNE